MHLSTTSDPSSINIFKLFQVFLGDSNCYGFNIISLPFLATVMFVLTKKVQRAIKPSKE